MNKLHEINYFQGLFRITGNVRESSYTIFYSQVRFLTSVCDAVHALHTYVSQPIGGLVTGSPAKKHGIDRRRHGGGVVVQSIRMEVCAKT